IASKNMRMGPMTQFRINERLSILVSRKTSPIFSKRTFASGGYIMSINPIASGILVVPLEKELMKPAVDGIKYPKPTPIAMARNIQRVKYWSSFLSFFFIKYKKRTQMTQLKQINAYLICEDQPHQRHLRSISLINFSEYIFISSLTLRNQ